MYFQLCIIRILNTGTACINVWELLASNSNFAALISMYDQVRLDGWRVRLSDYQ